MLRAPIGDSKVLLIWGTGLCKEPSRSATLFAAEVAQRAGTTVALDLDFRPDQWHDLRAFGVTIRAALRLVDIVLGTDDEINAALLNDASQMSLTHSQVTDARVSGDIDAAIGMLLGLGPHVLLHKRGAAGCRVHLATAGSATQQIDAPGFPVDVFNILGAGDAFAAGVLHGFARGWDWYRAARLGNACGAIVVTKAGCANFMPTFDEVQSFVAKHGGFKRASTQ